MSRTRTQAYLSVAIGTPSGSIVRYAAGWMPSRAKAAAPIAGTQRGRRSTTRTALPSLRGTAPRSTHLHDDGQAGLVAERVLQPLPQRGAIGGGVELLAQQGELVECVRPIDDQLVVRREIAGPEQHAFDLGWVEIDAADDQHVVVAAAHPAHADAWFARRRTGVASSAEMSPVR